MADFTMVDWKLYEAPKRTVRYLIRLISISRYLIRLISHLDISFDSFDASRRKHEFHEFMLEALVRPENDRNAGLVGWC